MKWSWRIARIFGIDVNAHATLLLLLAWVGAAEYLRERTIGAIVLGLAFMLLVFASIVLHELGHALMARRFGVRTRDITLLPIGGVARLDRVPEKPWHEFLVALAGPAVSAAIAILLFVMLRVAGQSLIPNDPNVTVGPFLVRLAWVNVSLLLFNLIPAFPMDGGRALRALLALRGSYVRATRTAAAIGRGIAVLLGIAGLFSNPFLAAIAVFIWIAAGAEAAAVQMDSALAGLPVRAAMVTEFHVLRARASLGDAADMLLAGCQSDFPVVDENCSIVGLLTRADLIRGLTGHGSGAPLATAMSVSGFAKARPDEALRDAMQRAAAAGPLPLLVVHGGRPVGIVTSESVARLLMVRKALRSAAQSLPGSERSSRGAGARNTTSAHDIVAATP